MTGNDVIVLNCPACLVEGPHAIDYAGRIVLAVRCLACGHETREPSPHLVSDYVDDLARRLVSKPARIVRRLQRHPVSTVRDSLVGVARQPAKLVREILAVRDATRRRP